MCRVSRRLWGLELAMAIRTLMPAAKSPVTNETLVVPRLVVNFPITPLPPPVLSLTYRSVPDTAMPSPLRTRGANANQPVRFAILRRAATIKPIVAMPISAIDDGSGTARPNSKGEKPSVTYVIVSSAVLTVPPNSH